MIERGENGVSTPSRRGRVGEQLEAVDERVPGHEEGRTPHEDDADEGDVGCRRVVFACVGRCRAN